METEEPKIRDVVRVAPSKPSLFKSWAQTHLTLVVLTLSQPCYTNFKLCRDVHSFTVRKNQISISIQTVDGQRAHLEIGSYQQQTQKSLVFSGPQSMD